LKTPFFPPKPRNILCGGGVPPGFWLGGGPPQQCHFFQNFAHCLFRFFFSLVFFTFVCFGQGGFLRVAFCCFFFFFLPLTPLVIWVVCHHPFFLSPWGGGCPNVCQKLFLSFFFFGWGFWFFWGGGVFCCLWWGFSSFGGGGVFWLEKTPHTPPFVPFFFLLSLWGGVFTCGVGLVCCHGGAVPFFSFFSTFGGFGLKNPPPLFFFFFVFPPPPGRLFF